MNLIKSVFSQRKQKLYLFRECSEADFPKPSNIGVSGNRTSFPKQQIFDIGEGIVNKIGFFPETKMVGKRLYSIPLQKTLYVCSYLSDFYFHPKQSLGDSYLNFCFKMINFS